MTTETTETAPTSAVDPLLSVPQVCELLSVRSASTLYALLRDTEAKFPQPMRLSARLVRWRRSDVVRWINAKAEAGGAPTRAAKAAKEAS